MVWALSAFFMRAWNLVNRGFVDGGAKRSLQEIKVAAFVGLQDVFAKHPTVAAFIAGRSGLPSRFAFGELFVTDV